MHKQLILVLIFFTNSSFSFDEIEATNLSNKLKKTLLSQVKIAMNDGGPLKAVEVCNIKALPLTNEASTKKYQLSRTSLRVRNSKNTATEEIRKYLVEFENSTANNPMKDRVITLKSGKKALLSPLYMQPACLTCHGTNAAKPLARVIKKLYPNDQAVGYKAFEFRGFVVVSENE